MRNIAYNVFKKKKQIQHWKVAEETLSNMMEVIFVIFEGMKLYKKKRMS